MGVSVQAIVRQSFAGYARRKTLPLYWHKAAQALADCRSAALGGLLEACPDHPDDTHPVYFSCHHRACPRCAGKSRAAWLEQQRQRLLDVPHAHVIFTLPHALLPLWRYNRGRLIDLQFRAAAETLHTLLADSHHLGATPGFLLALHTHGRDLGLHPHLHGLVTCGGVDAAGHWHDLQKSILLPARLVRTLYRGKLLAFLTETLDAGALCLPPDATARAVRGLFRTLYRKPWNVRLERRYRHGRGVVIYLARYVKGGPLSERRLVRADALAVGFRYVNHRDGKDRVLTLTPERFLERLFAHLPEPGKPTVRYYGLYSPRQAARLEAVRGARPEPPPRPQPAPRPCPACGRSRVAVRRIGRAGLNFLYKADPPVTIPLGGSAGMSNPAFERHAPPPRFERWEKSADPPLFFSPERVTLN